MSISIPGIALSSWLIQSGAVVLWLGFVALIALWLHHRTSNRELVRKTVHIGTGNVILLAWWLHVPAWAGIGASILFSGITLASYWLPLLPALDTVGRRSLGTFFYAVSIGVLVACFWSHQPEFAVLGILVMSWGDGLAALVGQRFGRHPYQVWGMKKSWEGSATMALVSFTVAELLFLSSSLTLWQTSFLALAIALGATGLEAFSKWGIDNLLVPLGSALLGYILSQTVLL